MRAEVSCLFHLEYHPDVVKQAQIGDGIHLQEIIPPNDWFDKILATEPLPGEKDLGLLLRAQQRLTGEPYTHRLYISLDEVADPYDPLIEDARQRVMQAIVLSRIVRPTQIALWGPWITSFNPNSGDAYHRLILKVGFYARVYVYQPRHELTLTNTDAARMAELWEPLRHFFTNSEKYRRIVRALKFFDGAYHLGMAEFRHIIFHAALESLICVSRDLNKKQITQRLPLLVPEITEKQASAIYELCCDFKHAASPLRLLPLAVQDMSASDQQRYKATEWLEQALRCLFQKTLSDQAFADLLADRGELARRYPVSSTRVKKSSIGNLIVRDSNIRGGRPIIAGTGVTVRRIIGWYKLGLSPEEIADRVGHLSLAQVYAALTYYHANKDELETDIAAEEAEADRLEREHFLASQGRV
jgi:uncharacterized protein (DUF433 family)